jgi:hypothetical protein
MEKRGFDNGIILLGVLIWMSVSVGPWWVGLVLFLCQIVLDLLVRLAKKEAK